MPRPQRSLVGAAAALVLLGGALLALGTVVGGGERAWLRTDERPVNAGAGELSDIRAHNSPTVVRNPRDPANLAVSSRIDTPRFSCALDVSFDGGARWRRTSVPIAAGERRACYAPDVAFAADGTLHLAYVTLRGVGNVPHALWVASSRDGGRTLGRPVRVSGPRAFQVRIATHPRDARRVHLTWLQAREVGPLRFTTTGNPIVTSRSADGGRTWRAPARVSAPGRERVLAAAPAVGSDGELYALFLDVGDDRLDYHGGHDGFGGPPYGGRFALVLGRSRDGERWEESVVDDGVVPVERFVPFIPAFPSLAIDRRSGRIFAGFHDGRRGGADVVVWTLDPGAAGWRGPVVVNDTPPGDRTTQRLPQLAVGDDGRLDVLYQDRRADPRDRMAEMSLQSSHDAGRSFGPRVRVSTRAFDARIGFGSEREMPDLGSRAGLVSRGNRADAVWSDTRHGTDASNKQDLMGARLTLEQGTSTAATLRQGALAAFAGGLAALGLALLRRRARARSR